MAYINPFTTQSGPQEPGYVNPFRKPDYVNPFAPDEDEENWYVRTMRKVLPVAEEFVPGFLKPTYGLAKSVIQDPGAAWQTVKDVAGVAAPAAGQLAQLASTRDPFLMEEVGRQGMRGLAESGMATAIGATRLVGADDTAEALRAYRAEEIRPTYGEPITEVGTMAQIGGRVAGDVAQFAAPGAAAGRIAKTAGISRPGFFNPRTLRAEVGRDIAFGAPIDAAIAASGREESMAGLAAELFPGETIDAIADSPTKRAAFEAAAGVALSGGLIAAIRKFQHAKRATRYQFQPEQVQGPPSASQIDVLGGSPDQLRRLEDERRVAAQAELDEYLQRGRRQVAVGEVEAAQQRQFDDLQFEANRISDVSDAADYRMFGQEAEKAYWNQQGPALMEGARYLDEARQREIQRLGDLLETRQRNVAAAEAPTVAAKPRSVGPFPMPPAPETVAGYLPRTVAGGAQPLTQIPARRPPGMTRDPVQRVRKKIPSALNKKTEEELVEQIVFDESVVMRDAPNASAYDRVWEDQYAYDEAFGAQLQVTGGPAVARGSSFVSNWQFKSAKSAQARIRLNQAELAGRRIPAEEIDMYQAQSEARLFYAKGAKGADRGLNVADPTTGVRIRRIADFGEVSDITSGGIPGTAIDSKLADDLNIPPNIQRRWRSDDDITGSRLFSGVDPTIARGLGAPLIGGAAGAGVGASVDEESPYRGAVVGGLIGAGTAAGVAGLGRARERRAAQRLLDADKAVGDLPRMVSEVPPSLGKQDFDVYIDQLRRDPTGRYAIVNQVQAMKLDREILNNRQSLASMERLAKASDVSQVLRERWTSSLDFPDAIAVADTIGGNGAYLTRAQQQIEQLGKDTPEFLELQSRINLMEEKEKALLKRYIGGMSANGRNLVAARLMAERTMSPAAWLAKAQRTIGADQDLPTSIRNRIVDMAEKKDKTGLVKQIRDLEKPLMWYNPGYLGTLVRAGMLTLPVSLGRALFGNSGYRVAETVAKPTTMLGDKLFSAVTGRRTQMLSGVEGASRKIEGFIDGVKMGPDILAGRQMQETLDKFDMPMGRRLAPVREGLPKALGGVEPGTGGDSFAQKYVTFVFGTQGALDRPFREAKRQSTLFDLARIQAFHGSLENQAGKQADKLAAVEDFTPRQRDQYVEALVKRPSATMSLIAATEAADAVFQKKTILSELAAGALRDVRSLSPGLADVLQATIFPFVRTPSAVATVGFESTPLGLLKTPHDLWKLWHMANKGEVDEAAIRIAQSRAARRFGRASTGILGAAMGYALFAKGLMTGKLPQTQGGRQQWQAEGKTPFSIYISDKVPVIGGRHHPVAQIQPFGGMLAFGAALAEADLEENGALSQSFDFSLGGIMRAIGTSAEAMTDPKTAVMATGGLSRSMLDVPFFSGTKEAIEAISQPERSLPGFAESRAGTIVPNLVAGAARASDPVVRDIDNMAAAVLARLPGASKTLPARPGIFGEEINREKGGRDRVLFSFMNLTGSRKDNALEDPIVAELQSIGFVVPFVTKKEGDTKEGYRKRQEIYGKITLAAIEDVLARPAYQLADRAAQAWVAKDPRFANVAWTDLADLMRRELMSDVITQYRSQMTEYLNEAGAYTVFSAGS
jgi:hypothetical protein